MPDTETQFAAYPEPLDVIVIGGGNRYPVSLGGGQGAIMRKTINKF